MTCHVDGAIKRNPCSIPHFFPFLLPGHSNAIGIDIRKIEMTLLMVADSILVFCSSMDKKQLIFLANPYQFKDALFIRCANSLGKLQPSTLFVDCHT